ncbi:MAG: sugar transferase [Thermodesulfobacteriota bacterium]
MNLLRLKNPSLQTRFVYHDHADESLIWHEALCILFDIIAILVSTSFIYTVRFAPDVFWQGVFNLEFVSFTYQSFLPQYIGFLILYIAVIILLFKNYDLYETPRGRFWLDELILVIKCVSIASLLLMVVMYLSKQQVSRFVVLSSWILNVITISGWRFFKHKYIERNIAKGNGLIKVLIVGAGETGRNLANILKNNKYLGMHVVGFVDDFIHDQDVLGYTNDVQKIIQSNFIDEVFITSTSKRDLVNKITVQALNNKASVKVIPDLFDGIVFKNNLLSLGFFGDLPVMEIHQEPISVLGVFLKRTMDIFGGICMFLISFPILMVLAVVIKIDSPKGPIVYKSKRVGKKGKIFNCFKFRTMIPNANDLKDKLRSVNEKSGPFFKLKDDPRVTKVGKFLRKYSLDELPQMFNVIKGDMSLVGPRPHPTDDFALYNLEHYRRLDVKPGITSLWAVEARNDPSFERNMELDLYYIENWDIWLDIKVVLKTIPAVFKGSGD